jgi:SAM-dependent methyltransferase
MGRSPIGLDGLRGDASGVLTLAFVPNEPRVPASVRRHRGQLSRAGRQMGCVRGILMRRFGRPQGVLGRLGGAIMARANAGFGARAAGLLGVQPRDSVLEVGFGPGVVVGRLAALASAGRVAGVDPSRVMVRQARARNAAAIRGGRVDLRHGCVDALPFGPGGFDKALAVNSMQVWPDPANGLREIGRVLRPGGRIALGFTPRSGQRREGLAHLLREAGFAEVRLVEVDGGFCALASKPWPSGPPPAPSSAHPH